MSTLWEKFSAVACVLAMMVCAVHCQCAFTKTLAVPQDRKDLMAKLNVLTADIRSAKHTSVDISVDGRHEHEYSFQLCPDGVSGSVGIEQKEVGGGGKVNVIGRYNESDVHFSKRGDFIILFYTGGDLYPNACKKGERHAVINIRCIPDIKEYDFKMIAESSGMSEDFCFYSFDFLVPAGHWETVFGKSGCPSGASGPSGSSTDSPSRVGPAAPTSPPAADGVAHHGLGAGSIILILILTSILAFFMIGSVYKRFVVGAQGWEQVPFIDFWRRCGSREGWRNSFGRGRSAHNNAYDEYSPVSTDEERQPALDRNGNVHDDHLLPM